MDLAEGALDANGSVFAAVLENRSGVCGTCVVDTSTARITLQTLCESSASCVHTISYLEAVEPSVVIVCAGGAPLLRSFAAAAAQTALSTKCVPKLRSAFDDTRGASMLRLLARPEDKVCAVARRRNCPEPVVDARSRAFRRQECLDKQRFYLAMAAAAPLLTYLSNERGVVVRLPKLSCCPLLLPLTALPRSQLLPGTVSVSAGTSASHVDVDNATMRVLELVPTSGSRAGGSLLELFKPKTKGGAQLLRASLLQPPAVESTICGRLDAVDELLGNEALYQAVSAVLATCPPRLEQVVASFAVAKKHTPGQAAQQVTASIAALLGLRAALALAPTLAGALAGASSSVLSSLHAVSTHPALAQLEAKIAELLDDEGPGMGRNSFAQRTNAVFALRTGSCGLLDVSRRKYCEITEAVNDLVTQYNEGAGGACTFFRATFAPKRGFFLTAPTADFDAAPPSVKQLFSQTQRKGRQVHLATPELKALNVRLLDASVDCIMLSQNALDACAGMVRAQLAVITALVEGVALLDVLHCFAGVVAGSGRTFVRPTFSRDGPIAVQNGHHPMLDAAMGGGCVPNNAFLSSAASLVLVAGPNAAGKSTYLRQVALLALLAHAGCYVPAEFATFRVLDRICCVGMSESDEMLHNNSTFMVECRELQHALATATRNSLVLMDELGRATSTGDAFALGLAACEHLVACNALCLCATHNERLLDTALLMPGVKSAHLRVVATSTTGADTTDLVFMHQLMEGAPNNTACRHYGILTAQRLGMPPRLVAKAKAIVEVMERRIAAEAVSVEGLDQQLTLFSLAQRLMTLHLSADGLLLGDISSSLRRLQEVAIQCAAKE